MRKFAAWLPFAYLVVYLVVALQDRAKLDDSLLFEMPPGVAVEDVIGFGFWPSWIIISIPFVLLCLISHGFGGPHRLRYWMILMSAFFCLTMIGAHYGERLEQQLLKQREGRFQLR